MRETTAARFERGFTKRLQDANGLAELLLELDPTYPGPVQPDDYPAVTLGWLRSGAILQYQATLAILAHPQCAGEAEILLRPMLDAFAHVAFVHQGTTATSNQSRRCRALCLELGVVRQRETEIMGRLLAVSDTDRAQLSRSVATQRAAVEAAHSSEACSCQGRPFSSARQTLHELAVSGVGHPRLHDYPTFHDQWIWSSGAAHAFVPTRLYRSRPDGSTVVGGPVRPGVRAMLLTLAVDIVVDTGRRVLDVNGVPPADRDRLTYWAANFLQMPPLRNALRGEFDN